MSENIAQTVQKVIQDLVAPDLRELKTVVSGNQKLNELSLASLATTIATNQKHNEHEFTDLQKQIDQRFEAEGQVTNANFKALMAAIAELKAQNELNAFQAIAALSERVAILESRQQ